MSKLFAALRAFVCDKSRVERKITFNQLKIKQNIKNYMKVEINTLNSRLYC